VKVKAHKPSWGGLGSKEGSVGVWGPKLKKGRKKGKNRRGKQHHFDGQRLGKVELKGPWGYYSVWLYRRHLPPNRPHKSDEKGNPEEK